MDNLEFERLGHAFVLGAGVKVDEQMLAGAVKVIAERFGIHANSVAYLIDYGYGKSMNDSVAGRAKAIESEMVEEAKKKGKAAPTKAAIEKAISDDFKARLGKRHDAIVAGTLSAGGSRDGLKTLASEIVRERLKAESLKATPEQFEALVNDMLANRRDALLKEKEIRATRAAAITVNLTGLAKA